MSTYAYVIVTGYDNDEKINEAVWLNKELAEKHIKYLEGLGHTGLGGTGFRIEEVPLNPEYQDVK